MQFQVSHKTFKIFLKNSQIYSITFNINKIKKHDHNNKHQKMNIVVALTSHEHFLYQALIYTRGSLFTCMNKRRRSKLKNKVMLLPNSIRKKTQTSCLNKSSVLLDIHNFQKPNHIIYLKITITIRNYNQVHHLPASNKSYFIEQMEDKGG